MLTKTKKIRKKSKMQNFKKQNKNGLETWRKGTFPPNLVLICMTGSEKTGFTDDGRRDDSSSAVQ